MDEIKEKVEQVVAKLKANPALLAQFKTQPVKALETILGVDLPDEKLQPIINGVKAKLAAGDAKDKLDDAKEALGGIMNLFKK